MSGINKMLIAAAIIFLIIPIILIAPALFAFIILAGIIYLRIKYPEIKGAVAERYVNRILSNLGPNYTLYQDLYVPNGKGGTTQADHVVTSPFGIFVIETKHYKGWIFGNEKQKYWTQVIYKRKEKLYNPIWQNYGHIQSLKNYLGNEDSESIHSIIAFSNQSTFKFKEEFKSARVVQFPQLLHVIQEQNTHKISGQKLREINRKLDRLVIKDKKEKRRVSKLHVESIKSSQSEKVRQINDSRDRNICPKCGGSLSLKKGNFGSFYGCSNYPKCRYTKTVS
ncbi:nuclease-related domain-containing protein [Bacillus marinisedimentorum]|uniref:nuclease-related domain-containing protein n=1 Tax=Bacillus marinisedimentorum TaxID=1821260 RepID=UPI000A4DF2CB|nr:NERD domain-containing protein [Bacillus marinisedimentorum]